MDKAKAYDEALKIAQCWLNSPQIIQECNYTIEDAIQSIFPQLKESDDERVRKDIIDHFESIKAQALYDNQEESDSIISSCNEKIAYLEKQKEQKSDWNEKDEKIIKTIIGVLERDSQVVTCEQRGGTMSGSVSYSNKYEEEIAWLKDISLNHKKFIEAVDKLWSNEWSEEDEEIIDGLIKYHYDQGEISPKHNKWASFLKSLRPIKQEWSEEDKDKVAQYLHATNGGMLWSTAIEITEDILDMLRPSWKSNKEHN